MVEIWHWPGRSLWLTSDIEVSCWWTKKQENWPCPWLTASNSDTYHHRRFTAKTIAYTHFVGDLGAEDFLLHSQRFEKILQLMFFFIHLKASIWHFWLLEKNCFVNCKQKKRRKGYILTTVSHCGVSCQDQVTLHKPSRYFGVQHACACVSVALGARQVPLLCSWAGLMRYQTQTSIHQPHWWGQWGATASVKRGIMASRVGIGQPCLQRLLSTEGLKQYTTPASTLLRSARFSSLTLGAASQDFFFFFLFISLIFWNKEPKKKNVPLVYGGLISKRGHVCVNGLKGEAIGSWLIK